MAHYAQSGSRPDEPEHPLVDRARTEELLDRLPRDRSARDELVRLYLPLIQVLARRFRVQGEPLDDLVQVASLGLLLAIERFDRSRGVEFLDYARPTIVGELRHFRERSWMVSVPRRLRDIGLELHALVPVLAQELGHLPAVCEIARSSGYSENVVLEAMKVSHAYTPTSLDALVHLGEGDQPVPGVGVEEQTFELLEMRWSVRSLLKQLPARERKLLYLRFFVDQNQRQIAKSLGISQMHVSRLLIKALDHLREASSPLIETEVPGPEIGTPAAGPAAGQDATVHESLAEDGWVLRPQGAHPRRDSYHDR